MVSGGSFVSWSVTWVENTVTVHVSALLKSTSGSRLKVCGPAVTVAACAPLAEQLIENHAPDTLTSSPNAMVTLLFSATAPVPSAGVVDETAGGRSASQLRAGVRLLRGVGPAAAKSAPLLSVSVQPPLARNAAVELDNAGAAEAPSKKFAAP